MALGTAAGYLIWLGWDQKKQLGPDGYLQGPYQWWQVTGLAITILTLAAIGGWLRRPTISALVIPATLTLAWSVDAATDPGTENDGLWPLGSKAVAGSSLAGVLLCLSLYAYLSARMGFTPDGRNPVVGQFVTWDLEGEAGVSHQRGN